MSYTHHENIISNMNTGVRFWKSTVSSSGYVPFHWHNSIEINCLLKGKLVYRIAGHSITLHPNEFIVVPSGVAHDVTNTPNTGFALQVPTNVLLPYCAHPEEVTFLNGRKDIKEYPLVVELIKQLDKNNRHQPVGYTFDNGILLLQLLKILFTKFRSNQKNSKMRDGIKECIAFINDHFNDHLTVAGLAQRFGYNASYLSRMFKQQTGIPLINYIYTIKLNQLYQELITTNIPISSLFAKNGLKNERTARQIFREMFGKLPSEIRRDSLK